MARKIEHNLRETLLIYELANTFIYFYMLGRPLLKKDSFDIDAAGLKFLFDEQLERELSSWINVNN